MDSSNDRGFPLPGNVVDTAFSRRLGIADMPIHQVPVISLTPKSSQAWILRLEVFRTRQESFLASFIDIGSDADPEKHDLKPHALREALNARPEITGNWCGN